MQAQLREMELQLTQKEHELQEREHHLEEQNCRPRTPPQNPRQSTPRRPRENIESCPTKRSRHIFEEDENEETEGEGEMEDDEDSPRVRDVGAVVRKVNKRQADDEADVDDEMDELADEYRYESLEFDQQVKALEHLNAPRVQAKEGQCVRLIILGYPYLMLTWPGNGIPTGKEGKGGISTSKEGKEERRGGSCPGLAGQ
ncbi:hypothetical protein CPB84DRAFT_1043406 [Gymnopilus junonius]|uniref:Uncharacterized protein n=1 Tax=Gymnopilus junonius TaxID=109634 RepID=A0A9P5NQB7_GYMJU|nr:hypothetical protein CPB84DRAFT_1043406 [Gymnopilus junonius]